MNTQTEPTKTKRAHCRFSKTMKFPKGDFSIKTMMSRYNLAKQKPTKVGVYLAIQRAVKNGQLEIAGTKREKNKRGRATILYRSAAPTTTQIQQPEQ